MPRTSAALFLAVLLGGCGPEPGDPPEDPFTLAVLTDTHVTGENSRADFLRLAVQRLNEQARVETIAAVLVLGDIAWGDGPALAKSLLDELTVPYVPITGDNEIYFGDEQLIWDTFAPQYATLASELDDFVAPVGPITLPDENGVDIQAWPFNLSFRVGDLRLASLDWNARGESGLSSETGDLMKVPGGTQAWMEDWLAANEDAREGGLLLFSHMPMVGGTFSIDEQAALLPLLEPHAPRIAANLAGHLHATFELPSVGELFPVFVFDSTWTGDDVAIGLLRFQRSGKRYLMERDELVVQ